MTCIHAVVLLPEQAFAHTAAHLPAHTFRHFWHVCQAPSRARGRGTHTALHTVHVVICVFAHLISPSQALVGEGIVWRRRPTRWLRGLDGQADFEFGVYVHQDAAMQVGVLVRL